jgi:hypothetical protein
MRRTHIMTGEDYDAFLVERRDGGLKYLALDNALGVVWVPEADDALHFSRRSDAERMVDNAPDEWDVHITDHSWMGGVPRDRVVPYAEQTEFAVVAWSPEDLIEKGLSREQAEAWLAQHEDALSAIMTERGWEYIESECEGPALPGNDGDDDGA